MSGSLFKSFRAGVFVLFGILVVFAMRRILYPTTRGIASVAVTTRVGSISSSFEASSTTIRGAITHVAGTSVFLKTLNGTQPVSDANTKRGSTFPPLQAPAVKGQLEVNCEEVTGRRQTENRMCPCHTFHERHSMRFDERLLDLGGVPARGVLLSGYFQSWKYLGYVENELRCRLRFRESVRQAAEQFLVEHSPTEWETGTYARIGVHVRRGDFLKPHLRQHGYTTPTMTYFRSAIDYFRKRHSRMHLVVTSDDLVWTRENFIVFQTSDVRVTFSEGHTGPVDLAILTSCHSLVLSTGTFGWWAAWLANVTTLYFKDWPQSGSVLESHLKRDDFFPPQWIAT